MPVDLLSLPVLSGAVAEGSCVPHRSWPLINGMQNLHVQFGDTSSPSLASARGTKAFYCNCLLLLLLLQPGFSQNQAGAWHVKAMDEAKIAAGIKEDRAVASLRADATSLAILMLLYRGTRPDYREPFMWLELAPPKPRNP